jgi:hypothetical protein
MARAAASTSSRVELAADRIVGIDAAEHDIGVGHRGPVVAEAVGDRSGIEPALSGPMLQEPPLSTQAMEPPPAPIVVISIIGVRTTMPKSIEVWAQASPAPAISETSKTCRPCRR